MDCTDFITPKSTSEKMAAGEKKIRRILKSKRTQLKSPWISVRETGSPLMTRKSSVMDINTYLETFKRDSL